MWKAFTIFTVTLVSAAAISFSAAAQQGSTGTSWQMQRLQSQSSQPPKQGALLNRLTSGQPANNNGDCHNVCSQRSQGTPACMSAQQECMSRQAANSANSLTPRLTPSSACYNVCSPRSQGTAACNAAQQECLSRQQSQIPYYPPAPKIANGSEDMRAAQNNGVMNRPPQVPNNNGEVPALLKPYVPQQQLKQWFGNQSQ